MMPGPHPPIPFDRLPDHAVEQIPLQFQDTFDIDALVANPIPQQPNQLLTNEDGTFVASDFEGYNTSSIALGDVDGDGDLDALLGGHIQPNQLFINQGGEQLGTEGTFVVFELDGGSFETDAIALGDVDGDGDLDAVVANQSLLGPNQLLINQDGEGTFVASDLDGGNLISYDIALGDVDGDGDLDAVVVNGGIFGDYQNNTLLINQGGQQPGTEGDFVAYDLPGGALEGEGIALGDVDGDGDLDVVVANRGAPNQLLINQDGEGTFVAYDLPFPESIYSSNYSVDVALGDVDGDGDLDAVFASQAVFAPNQLLINQDGEGTFVASDLPGGDFSSEGIALGDVDGDGDLDVLVANFSTVGGGGSNQVLINQNGKGTFVAFDLDGESLASVDIALGDVDGDGTVPAVDENGLPNIAPDGLLPDMYVDTIV
jgi:hypothetical protein